MAELSRIAKGSFTAGAATGFVNLPFEPDFVELLNYTNMEAGAAASVATQAWWDNALIDTGDNPTMVRGYSGGSVSVDDVILLATNVLEKTQFLELVVDKRLKIGIKVPEWLELDKKERKGRVLRIPVRSDVQTPIEEHLIVELYSK